MRQRAAAQILQFPAHRYALCQARDHQRQTACGFAQVVRGRFAFNAGIGGDDQFSDFAAGQLLAELDPMDYRLAAVASTAQLASAQTNRDLAAADLKRYQGLFDQGFISSAELERRDSIYKAAQAQWDQAQAQWRAQGNQVAYTRLTADHGGVRVGRVGPFETTLFGTIDQGGLGYSCLAELRTVETLLTGAASTPFLMGDDTIRIEMKDAKGARRTLDEVMKAYPKSEAAVAAKERLGSIKG